MSDIPKDTKHPAVDQGNNGDIPTRGQQAMLDLGHLQQSFPPVAGEIDPKPIHVSFDEFKKSPLDLPDNTKVEKILRKIREKFTRTKSILTRLAGEEAGSEPKSNSGAAFAISGLKEVNDILKNIDTAGLSEEQALALLENTLEQIEHLQAHMKQELQEHFFEEYETEEFQEIKEFLQALDAEEEQWQEQLEESKHELEEAMDIDKPTDTSSEIMDKNGAEKASEPDKDELHDGNTKDRSAVKDDKQPGRPRPK